MPRPAAAATLVLSTAVLVGCTPTLHPSLGEAGLRKRLDRRFDRGEDRAAVDRKLARLARENGIGQAGAVLREAPDAPPIGNPAQLPHGIGSVDPTAVAPEWSAAAPEETLVLWRPEEMCRSFYWAPHFVGFRFDAADRLTQIEVAPAASRNAGFTLEPFVVWSDAPD